MSDFSRGFRAGIPIGIGYLSVSFTFGIMAVSYGFSWWQAVIISMLTLTSAGQLAGITVMVHPGQYLEMLLSQLTINIRYSFMSVSLSQKVSSAFSGVKRWLLAFFMTDEIFAVASAEKTVEPKFFLGLAVAPYFGWALGTLGGSVLGNILPEVLMNSLCLAIYGMFLAIIAPEARASRAILMVIGVAVLLHILLCYLPFFKTISPGIAVSVSAVMAALLGAWLFPHEEEEDEI